MFNFAEATLDHLSIHKVGNKVRAEEIFISKSELKISDDFLKETLLRYFLTGFKSDEFFQFLPEDMEGQQMKESVQNVFDNPQLTFENSIEWATKLFEKSTHPMIKGGEFYVCHLSNCKFGDEYVSAIGLFKSETKDVFLKIYPDKNEFNVQSIEGINIKRLDKGCIIFNTDAEEGYKAVVLDKTNSGSEIAMYWKSDFLNLTEVKDSFYHTANYMDLCKSFCKDVFNEDNDVPRQDQVALLNKSFEYFDSHPNFDERDFHKKVIQDDPGVIEAFQTYKTDYEENKQIQLPEVFDVSDSAVKSNKKFFKSILKLDKKFHVYVHGGEDFIEKGFDDKKRMNYYKLFFHNEG